METNGLNRSIEDNTTMVMDTCHYHHLLTRECMVLHLMEVILCTVVISSSSNK